MGSNDSRTSSGLTGIVAVVEHCTAVLAAPCQALTGKLLVNAQKEQEKLGIREVGVAHFGSLLAW